MNIRRHTTAIIILCLCGICAFWIIANARYTASHDGDSLVPILSSLYYWTFFYWQQNRFGMLIPLLTKPISDPWLNLQIQNWLNVFCACTIFFLAAKVIGAKSYLSAGLLSLTVFLATTHDHFQFSAFSTQQPYPVSLALIFAAIALWDIQKKKWQILSFCLSLLGAWVNTSAPIIALLIIIFRYRSPFVHEDNPTSSRLVKFFHNFNIVADIRLIIVLTISLFAGYLAVRVSPWNNTRLSSVSLTLWPNAIVQLSRNLINEYGPHTIIVGFVILLILLSLITLATTNLKYRHVLHITLSLFITALVFYLFISSLRWLKSNMYASRYAIPSVILILVASAIQITDTFLLWFNSNKNKIFTIIFTIGLLFCLAYRFGPPSMSTARTQFDNTFGKNSANIINVGCTHLIGNYYEVWPAVLHSNMLRYEHSNNSRIWGITARSVVNESLWRNTPFKDWTICQLGDDSEREKYINAYHLPKMREVKRVENLILLAWDDDIQ
ncbi:MAG: hypothetical protein JW841_04760 [Deltaproteobacteria bacterium]|nr:hypothetical protein [Deltaproteobacteria bacterium]